MRTVGLHLRLVRWEDRLWLAIEAYLPCDHFKDAMALTKSLDPTALKYVSLREWHDTFQTSDEQKLFMTNLGQFVLPDDASIELDLNGILATVGLDWFNTGRQLRIVSDPSAFAKKNGESDSFAPGPWVFCHQYNEQLRQSVQLTSDEGQLKTVATGQWLGRDLIADRVMIDLSEPTSAAGVSTVMALRSGPDGITTNSQSLNGLLLGLPISFDQNQELPSKVPCRLVTSNGDPVFYVDLSLEGAVVPPITALHTATNPPYPELNFETVDWIDRIETVAITDPHRVLMVTRSWIDYQLSHSLPTSSGEEYFFRTATAGALRNPRQQDVHLVGSVPEAADDLAFDYTLGTLIEGSLERVSDIGTTSPLWRFNVSAGELEALTELLGHPDPEPFLTVLADTRVTAKRQDGSISLVGLLSIARRGLMLLNAPSEWVFLVKLIGNYDPVTANNIEYALFLPAPRFNVTPWKGSNSFQFSMFYPARWNAVRLSSINSNASKITTFRLALRSQVKFTPTTTTDVLDIRLATTSNNPLLDLSSQLMIGSYYEWLARDARSFAGLEISTIPVTAHWKVDRAYPKTDGMFSIGTRMYRCRFVADWEKAAVHPKLAASRYRVMAAGKSVSVTATLRDMYGRHRPLGLTNAGAASIDTPLRIGVFPPPLSSLVVRDQSTLPAPVPIPIPGNLQFLFTVSLSTTGQFDQLFTVELFFNQQLFYDLADPERVGQVWESVADAIVAQSIQLHFFELDLDNRHRSSGYLTTTAASQPQTIDVTTAVKAVLEPLLQSGRASNVSVQIPLTSRHIIRIGDTSSYFACAMEFTRVPELLAVNAVGGLEPVIVLYDNFNEPHIIRDDEIDGALATYQTRVSSEFGPIAIGNASSDGGLAWQRADSEAPCPGLNVPQRSLWPIPLPPESIDSIRLVGFVCVAPLLKDTDTDRALLLNVAQVLNIIRSASAHFFDVHPQLLSPLLRALDDNVTCVGPSESTWGYEDTSLGGAWTRLLDTFARRFDTLHGDLGDVSNDPDYALPDFIPRTKDGSSLGQRNDALGYLIRESLVRFWRDEPSAAWNQSALWVTSLSSNEYLAADEVMRHFKDIQHQLNAIESGFSVASVTSLGQLRPSMSAQALDRRKFTESVSLLRSDAVPLQTSDTPPTTLRVSSFRVPVGDVGNAAQIPTPVCKLPLPSTEILEAPVVERLGIESRLLDDPVAFSNAVRTLIAHNTSVRKSALSEGVLDSNIASAPADDILVPRGYASTELMPASPLTTYRSFLVAVKGDDRLKYPFARDRILLCDDVSVRQEKALQGLQNPWSELASISQADLPTFVSNVLSLYPNTEPGVVHASADFQSIIDELRSRIPQMSTTRVTQDETLAYITFSNSTIDQAPVITISSKERYERDIHHLSVVTLNQPGTPLPGNVANPHTWLFITFGFSLAASADIQLVHDRDGLWLTPGQQLIDPKYVQAQSVPLSGILRPQAKECTAMFPLRPQFTDGVAMFSTVLDTLLRSSNNPTIRDLADILALPDIVTEVRAELPHLYARLSLAVTTPSRRPVVNSNGGVMLEPVDWIQPQPQRWAHGFTYQLVKRSLEKPFTIGNPGTACRLQGVLTILSNKTERPVLTLNGIEFDVVP